MTAVIGISWQFPLILVGIIHGPEHWTQPFIMLGIIHGSAQWAAPLYLVALLSVYQHEECWKADPRTVRYEYGIMCTLHKCDWATPICRTQGEAFMRQRIHTRVQGHRSFVIQTLNERQLEVI